MNLLAHLSDAVIAQAADSAQDGGPFGGLVGMMPLVLMFAVIYFLMIRPANKQRREQQSMLNALKKDDEVVTNGGIYGRIVGLDEKVATLEIADKVKIRILRERIAGRWVAASSNSTTK